MRIAVTGSIAEDFLLTFPGRFADMILADQIDRLSLSFLADGMERRRGGVACNIAFGMGLLGTAPILVGAAGEDFRHDYQPWLERHGVDCTSVFISDKGTARFLCTTDLAQSQIATFYAGAMEDAREIAMSSVVDDHGTIDAVIVSPNDPEGMLRHTREAHEMGISVIADPSQQLSRMEGPDIRPLIQGARYLLCNDYERSLIANKTGWSDDDIRQQADIVVTTHGAKGAEIHQRDGDDIAVTAVPPAEGATLEPTGAGDAFRSGFLSALSVDLPLERAAQLGCAIATLALETVGCQEYTTDADSLRSRLAGAYDDAVASEILDALPIGAA